jgi:hypothetical protein
VSKGEDYDYYDRESRSYVFLECRLHQKYYSQSILEAELEDQYVSGVSSSLREHRDLQLADSDGVWFTRSEDPECYLWPTYPGEEDLDEKVIADEPRTCNRCDLICDIRNDKRYLNEDGTCPYPDPSPVLKYWKVGDNDKPCEDFLHPLLLQDVKAMNRKRARIAKAKLWNYLKQKKWRDMLINKGERIIDVWKRNYQPVVFYFKSFETIWLYLKNLPPEMKKNKYLLKRIRQNLEYSPSYKECLERGEWERRMLGKIDRLCVFDK